MNKLWKRFIDHHPLLLNHIDFSHPIKQLDNQQQCDIIRRSGSRVHDLSLWCPYKETNNNIELFDTICKSIKSIEINRVILFGHQHSIPKSLISLKPKVIHFATCLDVKNNSKISSQLSSATYVPFNNNNTDPLGIIGNLPNSNIQLQFPLTSYGSYKCVSGCSFLNKTEDIHRICPVCHHKFCISCAWHSWGWSNYNINNISCGCTMCRKKRCTCSLCHQLDQLSEKHKQGHISYYVYNNDNVTDNKIAIVVNPYSCAIHCKHCNNNKSSFILNIALRY